MDDGDGGEEAKQVREEIEQSRNFVRRIVSVAGTKVSSTRVDQVADVDVDFCVVVDSDVAKDLSDVVYRQP